MISQKLIENHYLKEECQKSVIEHLELNNQEFQQAFVYGFANFTPHDLRSDSIESLAQPLEEDIDIKNKYSLIISFLSLHQVNDVEALISKYKNSLNPGGMLYICFFGGKTFAELSAPLAMLDMKYFNGLAPRLMPKIDLKDAARLMQKCGLKNPISDSEELVVEYSALANLWQDIKALALGNVLAMRSTKYLGKGYLDELSQLLFAQKKFKITYELITIQGWRP